MDKPPLRVDEWMGRMANASDAPRLIQDEALDDWYIHNFGAARAC